MEDEQRAINEQWEGVEDYYNEGELEASYYDKEEE